jgi:hypothetical protein
MDFDAILVCLDRQETHCVSFEIVGKVRNISLIASGKSIRERKRLRKIYGHGRWRKLKGNAEIRLSDGTDTFS